MVTPQLGDWTREIVFDRLCEAAETLRRLPDRERRFLHSDGNGAWSEVLQRAEELFAALGFPGRCTLGPGAPSLCLLPWAPPRPCSQPGCGSLTLSSFWERHARDRQRRYDRARGGSAALGYGGRWRRLRNAVLQRHPFCQTPRCTAQATDVDHIVPRRRGGDDSLENLQGLYRSCHSRKTALEDGRWG